MDSQGISSTCMLWKPMHSPVSFSCRYDLRSGTNARLLSSIFPWRTFCLLNCSSLCLPLNFVSFEAWYGRIPIESRTSTGTVFPVCGPMSFAVFLGSDVNWNLRLELGFKQSLTCSRVCMDLIPLLLSLSFDKAWATMDCGWLLKPW
jgi:hypothetical protein